MKKIIAILGLIFISCTGDRTPIIGGEQPFVVYKIETWKKGLNVYTGHYAAGTDESAILLEDPPTIILKAGMYNVGDTIQIKDFK